MEFKDFKKLFQENFAKITTDVNTLFEVEVDKDEFWALYLDSFPAGTNEVYRQRREYDCSCCRHFVKNIGNAVTIKDNVVSTIWDFQTNSEEYQPVIEVMSNYIKSKVVTNLHVSKESRIGTVSNFEKNDERIIEWNHLNLDLPSRFVDKSVRSEGDIKGGFRDVRNVFKRSLDEISEESLLTVLELIASNTLYKGAEWDAVLKQFLQLHKAYHKLSEVEKENFTWEQSVKVGAVIGKIKNHSIGTLLINITEGME